MTNNRNQGYTGNGQPATGAVTLSAGYHNIVVAYNNTGGGYGLNVQMSDPNDNGANMVDLLASPNATFTPDTIAASADISAVVGNFDMGASNLIVGDSGNSTFSGNLFSSVTTIAGVWKVGTGNLTVTGSLNFGGTATVSGGTLQFGNGASGHDPAVKIGGISNSAAVVYDVSGSQTASYPISGPGTLTKAGPGTLTLTGPNTFTGAATINAGKVTAAGAALGLGTLTLAAGKFARCRAGCAGGHRQPVLQP